MRMPLAPSRFRRVAKRVGLWACVVVLVLWVAGSKFSFSYSGRGWKFGLSKGMLRYREYPAWYVPPSLGFDSHVYGSFNMGLRAPVISHMINAYMLIPMWLPFAVAVMPTALLWHRDRRTVKPGCCLGCGYDLRASKKRCPECGAAIAPEPP